MSHCSRISDLYSNPLDVGMVRRDVLMTVGAATPQSRAEELRHQASLVRPNTVVTRTLQPGDVTSIDARYECRHSWELEQVCTLVVAY